MTDRLTNHGNTPVYLFANDPFGNTGVEYDFRALQGTQWSIPTNPFEFVPANDWRNMTVRGQNYPFRTWNPGETKDLVRMKSGYGVFAPHIANTVDRNQPTLSLTYTTRTFGAVKNSQGEYVPNGKDLKVHKEHVFYYSAWCGDGVVDSQYGEVYDDGVNNGKPGYASTDCKTKNTPPTNGICDGASNGVPTYTAPTTNLCKTGTPSVVREENGKFVWTCNGVNGGSNATCEAPKKQDAYCGTADGQIFSTAPTTNLCAVGTATPVTGNNPYTWTCQGVNGGKDMTCATKPPQTPQPPAVCDQVFTGKLRVGKTYSFPDYYTNLNSYPHTLNAFQVDFRESHDMNGDGKLTYDNFIWSPPYGPGVQIPARAQRVKIIEASPRYRLNTAPAFRKKDNIYIEYSVTTTGRNTTSTHKECISYEVTWCGDGILDRDEGEVCDPKDPNKTGWGPGGCNAQCQPIQQETPKDLDLSIKKYLGGNNDAQPGSPAKLKTGNTFDYVLHVRVESGKSTGTTTVKDVLPAGVESTGNPYGNGWNCALQGKSLTCTTNAEVSTGNYFPEILVPVRVTATEGTVRNDATVHNPNEKPNSCYTDNRMPSGSEQSCERDPKNTDPAVFVVEKPQEKKPLLQIKKYAKGSDAQTASGAVRIAPGEAYDYTFEVRNIGTGDAKGAKVVDVLPDTLEVLGTATGTDWSCTQSGQTMTCRYSKTIKAGEKAPTITIRVRMRDSVQSGQVIRNVAGVCELDPTLPIDDPSCVINRDECKPGDVNYNPITNTCDPSTVIKDGGLDLSIKKYIDANDAQPGSPVSKKTNDTFNYVLKVKVESGTATGTTTVKDVLPKGVEMAGTATGNNWNITYNTGSRLIEATSTQVVTAGNYFPDITIPVKVTAGDNTTIRNDATVHNPNEKPNSCYTDNRMPSGSEQSCERDPKNTDPAVIKTPGSSGPGGGSNWGTVMCVNDIAVAKTYGSLQSCDSDRLSVTDTNKRSDKCMELDGQGTNAKWFQDEKARIQPYCRTTTPPGPGGPGGGG